MRGIHKIDGWHIHGFLLSMTYQQGWIHYPSSWKQREPTNMGQAARANTRIATQPLKYGKERKNPGFAERAARKFKSNLGFIRSLIGTGIVPFPGATTRHPNALHEQADWLRITKHLTCCIQTAHWSILMNYVGWRATSKRRALELNNLPAVRILWVVWQNRWQTPGDAQVRPNQRIGFVTGSPVHFTYLVCKLDDFRTIYNKMRKCRAMFFLFFPPSCTQCVCCVCVCVLCRTPDVCSLLTSLSYNMLMSEMPTLSRLSIRNIHSY